MKKIPVFIALSCISIAGAAQQKDFFDIQKYLQKKSKESKPVSKPFVFLKPSFQNFETPGEFSHSLPNGDKVYILSQDNMPCVSTELNRFDISNVYREHAIMSPFTVYDSLPGSMPNASVPYKIYFSK